MQVLIVEDEALVAMDLAETIEELGHTVAGICGSCDAALGFLAKREVDFAILDFNLGRGTSAAIADQLVAKEVPFVFLTGYRREALPERFHNCAILAKPMSREMIESVLFNS